MPVASAQIKSCLILAGLYADGTTIITEPQKSRDHTERMLMAMGAEIRTEDRSQTTEARQHVIKVEGMQDRKLNPIDITVPSDFSSAAFFIAGAFDKPLTQKS